MFWKVMSWTTRTHQSTTLLTTRSIRYRKTLWAFLIIIALRTPAHAQDPDVSLAPISIGAAYHQMVPREEFRENTRDAPRLYQGALGFDLIFHLQSAVNLRLDFLFGTYDKNPCKGWCDNYSFRAGGVSGELVLPRGPVRPYATAGVGRLSLRSFEDANGKETDTGTGYSMYGAGVKIPFKQKWSADMAWRRHAAGPVSYQYAQQNPDGSITVGTAHTRTPFDLYTAGLQYRFGRK